MFDVLKRLFAARSNTIRAIVLLFGASLLITVLLINEAKVAANLPEVSWYFWLVIAFLTIVALLAATRSVIGIFTSDADRPSYREISSVVKSAVSKAQSEISTIENLGLNFDDVSTEKNEELDRLAKVFQDHKEKNYLGMFSKDDMEEILDLGRRSVRARHLVLASSLLDIYVEFHPEDHQGHFQRGVAYANQNGNDALNNFALLSFSAAIATVPGDFDQNRRARYFSYRAAMYKRIGEFDKALADLDSAAPLASNMLEHHDVIYNRCCIFALTKRRSDLVRTLNEWSGSPAEVARIRKNMKRYFEYYERDPQFLKALKGVEERLSISGKQST